MSDRMVQGRLQSSNGQLYVVPRPSSGIPHTLRRKNGWAIDRFGYSFIEDAGSAVPSTRKMYKGMAFTDDGALYVTDTAPASSAKPTHGLAIREDGAVHVNSGAVSGTFRSGGLLITDGRLFISSDIYKSSTAAFWFKFNTGITVTGAGVSQWDDQSGNTRHLKQGTDTNRPALQADGTILFDGADNFLKCDAFTFAQPETIYVLGKQVTWTANDRWFDGNTNLSGTLQQRVGSPQVGIVAAAAVGNISPTLDTYCVISCVFNGASSRVQLNHTAAVSGDVGAGDMGGLTLGANGTPGTYGNVQIKELIGFSAAHDANTRARIIDYLINVNGGTV